MRPELEAIKRDIRSNKTRKINFYQFTPTGSKFSKVGTAILEPLQVYWNLAGTICVLAYELNYMVYKVNEQGHLFYYGEKGHSVIYFTIVLRPRSNQDTSGKISSSILQRLL
jgi:hypothetical protein